MILDLAYTNRDYYASNQVKFRSTYLLSLRATGLYTKKFLSSSQCFDY